jgi:type I restriction enzyme R subunit
MSNNFEAADDQGTATNSADIEANRAKRLVFIIDEAHRSTFGDMLSQIKASFPQALFFGFTGTPIHAENEIKGSTTPDMFGNELHRYSLADGIRDGNVLGFDPYKVLTFKDKEVRQAVALEQVKADSVTDAMATPAKKKKFNHFMNDVAMAGYTDLDGTYVKGIEDYLPKSQYLGEEHQAQVVADIIDNWDVLSQASKFHAILATNSIAEAIDYYRLFKVAKPDLKVSALFDPNIDNNGGGERGATFKGDGLEEIMTDYNALYGQDFDFANHSKFKKDLAARMSHKAPYERIHNNTAKQLDLMIVVDQMLTGFDSKWVNTLYLDKVIKYQNIIQAFSRTNRLFGPDKPHGTIRYYRYPHTMERHIEDAVKLYSGDKPLGLFADKLESNLEAMNEIFAEIETVFVNSGVKGFEQLPDDAQACAKFAGLYRDFNKHLEAAKIQGLDWEKAPYTYDADGIAELACNEQTYLGLALRYRELASESERNPSDRTNDIPFDLVGHLTEIDTGRIDSDYMNSRFDKYLRELSSGVNPEETERTLNELHQSFSSLTQNEQKYAKLFIHELQRGDAQLVEGNSFRDYINNYQNQAEQARINGIVEALGLDRDLLVQLMNGAINKENINRFGRLDTLKATVDKAKAKAFFEMREGTTIPPFKVNMRIDKYLQEFIFEQSEAFNSDGTIGSFEGSQNLLPEPLTFGDIKLYSAKQVMELSSAVELGAITFKTDATYEHNPASLLITGCYSELKKLGVVSSSILDTTLIALLELEQVTKELELPLYQESQSGIVWALKEAKEGSIYHEFIAFFIEYGTDPGDYVPAVVIGGVSWLRSKAFQGAFIAIPNQLKARKQQQKEKQAIQDAINSSPNVTDFKTNKKLAEKWKDNDH